MGSESDATKELDVNSVMAQLTMVEKVALTGGGDFRHSVAIPRLGVPRIRFSDSPVGVRGISSFNGPPGSCYPCTTALASSWDEELMEEVGMNLGMDARARGVHVLQAPTVNLQRSPLGGRTFEAFGEDPYLCGRMAVNYVRGLQSQGVASAIKHFVCNDQEHERMGTNVLIGERALREVYLRPFEMAIRESTPPKAIMVAYNSVNGTFCNENAYLLDGILRKEWEWDGLTMSDYFAVTSTAESIKAGLNIEMPAPPLMRGGALIRALGAFRVSQKDIDKNARRVLQMANHAISSKIGFEKPEKWVDGPERRAMLRRAAAESSVLLKNDRSVLPLKKDSIKKIAIIGPNGKTKTFMGGGSATMRPTTHVITFLDGITEAVGADIDVKFAIGCHATKLLPEIHDYCLCEGETGMRLEFYNANPWDPAHVDIKPAYNVVVDASKFILVDEIPAELEKVNWIKVSAKFLPDQSGKWEFGLILANGQGDLYIDNQKVIDNSTDQKPSWEFFACAGTIEEKGYFDVESGKEYDVEIRFCNERHVPGTTVPLGKGALQIGARCVATDEDLIQEAERLARESDAVICAVGLDEEWEAEGYDRANMDLPGRTDDLVARVLKANPNTVVVVQCGGPVTMPWVNEAATLVHAFYGGNEFGNALADVIFGEVNPCARLCSTFPYKVEHTSSYYNWGDECGESRYGEGVFIGYRHFDATDREPMFPFGHGISYHKSELSGLAVDKAAKVSQLKPIDPVATIRITVENATKFGGKEVVQVYLAPHASKLRRAPKELQAFSKIAIGPFEKKECFIPLRLEALGYFNPWEKKWIADKGKYGIYVGLSSRDIRAHSELVLDETIEWTRSW